MITNYFVSWKVRVSRDGSESLRYYSRQYSANEENAARLFFSWKIDHCKSLEDIRLSRCDHYSPEELSPEDYGAVHGCGRDSFDILDYFYNERY